MVNPICTICYEGHATKNHICLICGAADHEYIVCPQICTVCSSYHLTKDHQCEPCEELVHSDLDICL